MQGKAVLARGLCVIVLVGKQMNMAKRTQLSVASRRRLYELERTGEAIYEELIRHAAACNEKANKRMGLPLTTRNVSVRWAKQELAYYHALKQLQRDWEARNPGWEMDEELLLRCEALWGIVRKEGTLVGRATENWDARTQQRNMDACRWDKVKPRGEMSAEESRRLACRVTKPAKEQVA